MKKRLLVAPLAVALAGSAWAGTTLYAGTETRDAYERLVGQLDDALGGLSVRTASMQDGFLSSVAITEVRASEAADAPVLARLRHEIEHSPVDVAGASLSAARIVTTFLPDETAGAAGVATAGGEPQDEARALLHGLLAGFGDEAPLTLVSTVGFDGASDNRLSLAAWQRDVDGTTIATEPGAWDVAVTADGSFEGTGRWGGAVVQDGEGSRMSVGALEDRFAYTRRGDRLYDGEYRADIARSELREGNTGMGGVIGAMAMTSSTSIDTDRASFATSVELAEMALPVPLETLRYELGATGLDLAALRRVIAVSDEVNAAMLGGGAEAFEGEAFEARMEGYFDALAGLVVPGSEATLALHLGNAGGDADARLGVTYEGGGSSDGTGSLRTVGDLARSVRATLALDVDESAVAITPAAMFVDPAALAPWIVADAGAYTADIVLDDMIVDVNGMPMSLEDMVGDALSMPLDGLGVDPG